ncbi:DJ-1/PfpI family protein [Methyloligella sp. 2.7D]|uniref:DJ-1/PfpI family protein n=1 Tax=unclassified Methyloligella TaxID=2625955 RepID=UPI00157C9D11|nr:DJ-1/PfpI family protein [Methyloligella sp. GL2]QKP76258.1 DJ-1/PfpI family protein [Methyloligella sp. GL2]
MALEIGFLLFPDIQQLDLAGPFDVLAAVPETRLHLAAKTEQPVASSSGLTLTPTVSCVAAPQFDILCIPGGRGVNPLLQDEETLAFVAGQAAGARYVTSVCTGALVLGAAGLLHGKRATTHWTALDLLSAYGATPVKARAVQDGNLITGGGVTAGIDFGLALAAELAGQEVAEAIQLGLEYAPAPPFDAGSPDTASAETVASVLRRTGKVREARERLAAAYAAKRED